VASQAIRRAVSPLTGPTPGISAGRGAGGWSAGGASAQRFLGGDELDLGTHPAGDAGGAGGEEVAGEVGQGVGAALGGGGPLQGGGLRVRLDVVGAAGLAGFGWAGAPGLLG
jgi:hypothetical protein